MTEGSVPPRRLPVPPLVRACHLPPTLAVTAREAGGAKWALLQLAWMSGVAYLGALAAYRVALMVGV